MIENQRLKTAFEYLKEHRYVRNQQDFTERIGSDKSTVSQIMNERITIPNVLFGNIAAAFPIISEEWLRTGNGEMLKSTYTQQIFGDGQTTQTGNINSGNSEALMHALNEITEMRKLLASALEVNQRTNDRLLTLLENMNTK